MDADPRLENRVGFFMVFTSCSDRVSWTQNVGTHQEIFTSDTTTASGRYPVNFVDPMGLDAIGYTGGGAYAIGGRIGNVVAGGGFGVSVSITINGQGQLSAGVQVTRENGLRLSGGAGPQVTLDKYDGGPNTHNIGLIGGTIAGNSGKVTYTHGKFDAGYSYSEPLWGKEGSLDLGSLGKNLWDLLQGGEEKGEPCK